MSAASQQAWPDGTALLQVGDVQVDLRFRRLLRDGTQIELAQRTFDLLLLFLAEPQVMHTRASVLERIWAGVIVEDANLSQGVWTLRNALGPARRDWIRTVPKRGYVFEPPHPIEIRQMPAERVSVEAVFDSEHDTALPHPAQARNIPATAPARRHTSRTAFALSMSLLVVVLLAFVGTGWRGWHANPAGASNLSIAVVEIADSGTAAPTRWPATLLRSWLEFKLSLSPQVNLLTRDHLAADHGANERTLVLLLSSGEVAGTPGRWFVQAQVDVDGVALRERIEAGVDDLPARIDAMSTLLMQRVLHAGAATHWPELRIDPATAPLYVEFFRAREARQWSDAERLGRDVVNRAPGFGLAHLQLSQVLGLLGQMHDARERMDSARALLQPLPVDADALLHAQELVLLQEVDASVEVYAEFARRWPRQARFAIEHARVLLMSDRAADALQALSGRDWRRYPVSSRFAAGLARSHAQLRLGDPVAARRAAKQAYQLASDAQWPLEQGLAMLALAGADTVEHRGVADASTFERAAEHLDAGGDPMRALEARLYGARVQAAAADDEQLDALLARARTAGNRTLEIEALRIVAFRHYRAGDMPAFRDRLLQAVAVAEGVDDRRALLHLDLDLIGLDIDRGDYEVADRRLARLDEAGAQGEAAFWIEQFGLALAWRRGDLEQARQRLDAATVSLASGEAPIVLALNHCTRGFLDLTAGEASLARAAFQRCAESPAPVYRLLGELGLARVELYSGDRAAAVQRLNAVVPQLASIPSTLDQRLVGAELADLAVRANALSIAMPQLQRLRDAAHDHGLSSIEAESMLGLARVAFVRSEWRQMRSYLDRANALAPKTDWSLQNALRLLRALDQFRRGDSEAAATQLAQLDEESRARGDVLVESEVHAALDSIHLEAGCPPQQREALRARTGLHGLRSVWPDSLSIAFEPASP